MAGRNSNLKEALDVVFADHYKFSWRAKVHHWNVVGKHFSELHEFFEELYNEVYGATDNLAEYIRTLDFLIVKDLEGIDRASEIPDLPVVESTGMINDLYRSNQIVLKNLKVAYSVADNSGEYGISNFLAGRIDAHQKHGWMLKSMLEEQ